jgi:phage tail-like protein
MATPINWYTKFKYIVEIDGVARAGFTTASDIGLTAERVEYREGGRLHPHKAPGTVTFAPVTLERGACSDFDLYNWTKDTYDSAAETGVATPDLYRNVEIVQLDRDGSEKERFILYDAWVAEYVGGSWDNNASEVRMEKVVVEFDHFDRVPA